VETEFSDGIIGIRRYQTGDVADLFAAARESIVELSSWMQWCGPNYSLEESTAWVMSRESEWNQGEHYSFVIFDAATKQFLGSIGLNFINRVHHFANLGYWVRKSATKRGVATRAVRLAAQFAFTEAGLSRIEIVVALTYIPSQRVAEKAGAHFVGLLRKRLFLHDQAHDAKMYSLSGSIVFTANSRIISQILGHCRRHEAGEITATQLEGEIEAHSPALEGITSRDISRFRNFSARLVQAHFDDTTASVMAEFRAWLTSFSDENAAYNSACLQRTEGRVIAQDSET